ncbi:cytochrome P450 [Chytridium lagenaria]|nr:cytochrome P450 [Chytridium lagenaria]
MMQARYKEFLKPIHHYGVLDVFGRNIVSTESDDWRRHRKISAPQFSERNNALVHDEAVRTARMMFEAWEEEAVNNGKDLSSQGFEIDASKDMMRFALTVISSALFGMQLQWGLENETKNKPAGHTLSFQQSLETMLHNLVLWLMFPKPMFYLPIPVLTETRIAFQEFSAYLKELLDSARTNRSSDANLINMLVQAADDEGEKAGLSETELTGNAFAFILAGHETTAGALQYALSVLAEQPELQEKLYNHVKEVVGDEDAPTFKDFSSLTYVQAMMQETLRMYPIVTTIPKWTADASLNLGPWVLPPKTYVNVVTTGLHFHPEVWEEPLKFNPDRFLGNYNRNAWVPFSEGPRGCLGKKFSQVEFVCALSTIVLRYRFTPALGADPEAYKEPFSIITLKPKNPVKLTFYKR